MNDTRARSDVTGLLYGVAAYGWWGVVAIYFKLVRHVAPLEVLAHRIIWSVVVLAVMLTVLHRWDSARLTFRRPKTVALLTVSTTLIALNWFLFIWAVGNNHMVDASLGYFINPLVNVLLGFAFLGERLRPWEWLAVAIAASGVIWLTIAGGRFPWISLTLAVSFGLYGLIRKVAHVASIEGLSIETTILLPFALGYLAWSASRGTLSFGHVDLKTDLLLGAAGIVTALPLVWFANAVKLLRLSTVGLLQYMSPTIQFCLAVFVYDEPFSRTKLIAFAIIWFAVGIYSAANVVRRKVA